MSEFRTGESTESGEEIPITHEIGVEVLSYRVADHTGYPGSLLLRVPEEFELPSTEPSLMIGIPMNKWLQAGTSVPQARRFFGEHRKQPRGLG